MNRLQYRKQQKRSETIPRSSLGRWLRILEIGCGDGMFWRYVRQRLAHQCETFIGYDVVNLISKEAELDAYYCDPNNEVIENIIQEHNINLCIIAYTLHHILDDGVVSVLFDLLYKNWVRLLVCEEFINPKHPKTSKSILIANDVISNIRQYGCKLPKLSEFFALNFKTQKERSSLIEASWYKVVASQQSRKYGYILAWSLLYQP